MLDYVVNTPEDSGTSHISVQQRSALIRHNLHFGQTTDDAMIQRALAEADLPEGVAL
jgi:hypothetical protein